MTENYATGGYVSGPKPGDPPFLLDGCMLWRPERMPEPPSGLTIQVNTEPGSIYADTGITALQHLYQWLAETPPPEPVKLTSEQLEQLKTLTDGPTTMAAPSLLSVPIEIVERVEDSTPYKQRREKLKAAFEAAMRVPYPQIEPGSER